MLRCFGHQRTIGVAQRWRKRPDDLTLVPWQNSRRLTWDATVVESLATSYLSSNSKLSTSWVGCWSSGRSEKSEVSSRQAYPRVLSGSGWNIRTSRFLDRNGDGLTAVTGDRQKSSFLYQWLAVLVQRFNMIAFRGSFISETDFQIQPLQLLFLSSVSINRDLYYRWY